MSEEQHIFEDWESNPRWKGILRPYSVTDVLRLSGSIQIEHTLARMGALRLWNLLNTKDYVPALSAMTGTQAVQEVEAGLEAIYVSGWQVAADANEAGKMYPDQSLYSADSVPNLVKRVNQSLLRADQIQRSKGGNVRYWFAPIIADAEAGFGGVLNTFELMKSMIEAGAAGVHFEDQQASDKKCGHLGGKVLVPTREFIKKLVAARLAADVLGVPTLVIARTDAYSARLLTNDIDPRDQEYLMGERTHDGYFRVKNGLDTAIARGLAYAPYADMLWCETSSPGLDDARRFAEAIHAKFPGKLLAYNCSPSFNWNKKLDAEKIAGFQDEIAAMGYKFQFITLSGFHALNHSTFKLAWEYARNGMVAYSELQQAEFAAKEHGYKATEHQTFVGTEYFDDVSGVISGGSSPTLAMDGSTEKEQFTDGENAVLPKHATTMAIEEK